MSIQKLSFTNEISKGGIPTAQNADDPTTPIPAAAIVAVNSPLSGRRVASSVTDTDTLSWSSTMPHRGLCTCYVRTVRPGARCLSPILL